MTASDDKYKSFDDDEVLADSAVFMMAGMFTEKISIIVRYGNNCDYTWMVLVFFCTAS